MNFPEIGPAHATEIEISKKILDQFPSNPSMSQPGKLKFRKKFWMSFPVYANEG